MAGLFSSFNVGRLAIGAQQTALQVIGQNIANANTEGYTRQRPILETTRPQDLVYAQIGTGVQVAQIERIINLELESRIQDSFSALGSLSAQESMLRQVEALFNELSEADLSTEMTRFFDALSDLSTDPEDSSHRGVVLERAMALTDSFQFLATRLNRTREQANDQIVTAVGQVNGMTNAIAELNKSIILAENAGANYGTANDLRDKRDLLLKQLSEIVDIRAIENDNGAVSVLAGSDFLVFNGENFELTTAVSADRNIQIDTVEFTHNGQDLTLNGGSLRGLVQSRDVILTEFIDDLNTVAATLISEFNQIHAAGRGLDTFSTATSAERVDQPSLVLNQAGLPFTPVNGSFEINIHDANGVLQTINIEVDLDGLNSNDTTLDSLIAEINAESGGLVTTSVSNTNNLQLTSSNGHTFSFSNDTSGALSALGINTFFTGSNALTVGVNTVVRNDTDLIATARPEPPSSFLPGDNNNVQLFLGLRDAKLLNGQSATMDDFYQGMIGSLAVQAASAQTQAGNQQVLHDQLLNEREMTSGVNLDEETISLISHQRAFQAAARFISVIDELLNTLINAT